MGIPPLSSIAAGHSEQINGLVTNHWIRLQGEYQTLFYEIGGMGKCS
jgi:hypothetical protein